MPKTDWIYWAVRVMEQFMIVPKLHFFDRLCHSRQLDLFFFSGAGMWTPNHFVLMTSKMLSQLQFSTSRMIMINQLCQVKHSTPVTKCSPNVLDQPWVEISLDKETIQQTCSTPDTDCSPQFLDQQQHPSICFVWVYLLFPDENIFCKGFKTSKETVHFKPNLFIRSMIAGNERKPPYIVCYTDEQFRLAKLHDKRQHYWGW